MKPYSRIIFGTPVALATATKSHLGIGKYLGATRLIREQARETQSTRNFIALMDYSLEGKSKQGGYNKEGRSYKDTKKGRYNELGRRVGRVPDGEHETEDNQAVTPPRVTPSKKYNTRRGGSSKNVMEDDAEFIGHDPDFQRITRRGARTRSKERQTPHVVDTYLSSTSPSLPSVILGEFYSSDRHVLSKSRGAPNKSQKDVEHFFLALKVR